MKRPALLLVLVLFVASITAALLVSASERKRTERAHARSYALAIDPSVKEGGRIVVELVKPRLSDVVAGRVSREKFVTESSGWIRQLGSVQASIRRVAAPGSLKTSKALLIRSLDGYIAAVTSFRGAVASASDPAKPSLDEGIRLAQAADKTYDRAHGLLVAELKRLGS